MQEYPKWKYHRAEQAQIVESPAEEEALGPGWADSPAEFEQAPEPEPKKKRQK